MKRRRDYKPKPGEILRKVQQAVAPAILFGGGGGIFSVHEAQILLSYLLEYSGEEGNKQNADNGASSLGMSQRDVRMLWRDGSSCDPSCQRGLAGQQHREFTDTLRLLSSTVARFASEAGYPMLYADAAASFPLGDYVHKNQLGKIRPKNRVGRLRAYGNAVDAEATREFCEAMMESL